MAKITNLDVGTIKIANAAVTGSIRSTFTYPNNGTNTNASVTVADNFGNPVVLFWDSGGTMNTGGSSNQEAGGDASFSVKKGATILYTTSRSIGKNASVSLNFDGSYIDWTPAIGQVYSTTGSVSTFGPGGSGTMSGTLVAMYFKK